MSGNRRRQPVQYRKFETKPNLATGLLEVARQGGDLERRVAAGLARIADEAGEFGDRQAQKLGVLDGQRAAMEGAPGQFTEYSAGETGGSGAQESDHPQVPGYKSPGKTASGTIRVNPRGESVARYYREKHGLSSAQAAALAGHGMAESKFNTTVRGDNGTAMGAFQWRGDRLTGLQKFAKSTGRSSSDLHAQLDYALHELRGKEGFAGRRFFGARNVDEATEALMHFERPQGYTRANPRGGHNFSGRLAFAKSFLGESSASAYAPDKFADAEKSTSAAIVKPTAASTGIPDARYASVSVRPAADGPRFRPTGRDTVYGRSYDVSGTRTYLQMLDTNMRSDMSAVFDAYSEDPQMLQQSLGELKSALLKESVFDEIAPDFVTAFDRTASSYLSKARRTAQVKLKEANTADWRARSIALEGEVDRTLHGIDPRAEGGADELTSILTSYDDHIDTGVANGLLKPDAAVRAKAARRSAIMSEYYGRQAEGLSSTEVGELREQMRKDYAAGKLSGVDAGGWDRLNRDLEGRANKAEREEKTNLKELAKTADDALIRMSVGSPDAAEAVQNVRLQAESVPGGTEVLERLDVLTGVAERLKTDGPRKVARDLPSMVPDLKDASLIKDAANLVTRANKKLEADPLGYAEQVGALTAPVEIPIGAGIDELEAAVTARAEAAKSVSEQFEVPVKFWKPGEAAAFKQLVEDSPEQALDLASAMVGSLKGKDRADALRELGKTARPLEQAGAILASGGTSDAAFAALQGGRRREDGSMRPGVPVAARREAQAEIIKSHLDHLPDEVSRIGEAAEMIARYRMEIEGVDPKSDDATEIYKRALHEAVGGSFVDDAQYGGFSKVVVDSGWVSDDTADVVVPSNVRADRFDDVLEAITDADLAALPVPPASGWTSAKMTGAVPVAVDGGWEMHINGAAVPNSEGKPLVLDFDLLGQRLAKRVPGAIKP